MEKMTISEKMANFFGGMDKVAHFGIGGLICSVVSLFLITIMSSILALHPWIALFLPFIGYIIVWAISYIKEVKLDPVKDMKDLKFAMYGCIASHIPVIIAVIICLLI